MKISEILAQYETDKVNGHCYGNFYDELFERFDRNAPLEILEIGTQKGGSLLAWKEFCPNANVTGIDIIDVRKPEYISEKINYIFDDVKNVKLDKKYDIIIDDGSHFLEDVLYVTDNFYENLKEGGVIVVEDVQDPAWIRQMEMPCYAVDLRHVNGNYDDFLIVIEK